VLGDKNIVMNRDNACRAASVVHGVCTSGSMANMYDEGISSSSLMGYSSQLCAGAEMLNDCVILFSE
jgi:hypothetical protein